MGTIEKDLLLAVSDLHQIPSGAFSIRENGKGVQVNSTENIQIIPKGEGNGIDIYIKENTKNESVHIPVIISKSGIEELVYNDFYIGKNSDVLIVAGCGIHNTGDSKSSHDGIHRFHLEEGAKVRYVEKHIGVGSGAEKVMNPVTEIEMGERSELTMETTQLGGVSYSERETFATLEKQAKLVIKEKILTSENQVAKSKFRVELVGKDSSADVVSRSVARDESYQSFFSSVVGRAECFGHVECDAIIMDKAKISATPEILAEDVDSKLVHEAVVGKIAGEQLIKLMTLGLCEKEAEELIIKGFLS
ncbi:MAG: SufD family Fe-S cluster assembly protein [Clostridia bacterium]|nr:SufD family Fe-S cluster assembly protein [Clostridia bacterium]